jgi:hypothetical protein
MLRNLILTRDVSGPLELRAIPAGITLSKMRDTSSPSFAPIDELCTTHRFPAGWTAEMLAHGAQAWVLTAANGCAVAAAWLIRSPFFIDEIKRTFDAGPEGDYYFGDFVAPDFRGQHLQRLLINVRLTDSQQSRRRWAIALARAENAPSVANYTAEGFLRGGIHVSRRMGPWRLDRECRLDHSVSVGTLTPPGLRLPCAFSLHRPESRR